MSVPLPTFPEYGQGGDFAGQRRLRRSFRYGVLTVTAFAAGLWYYEGYHKLSLHETQYVMSLTLATESARPVLRNILRRETEGGGAPTPLYVEALAGVEEPERVLPTYEEAVRLNPRDGALLIKYGCELYLRGEHAKARDTFREAGVHPPRNALASYLEAAALAAGVPLGGDLTEAMAIIARANNMNAPVLFPAPLWHKALPRRGEYYARHRRELATRVCAPLSAFKQRLIERATADIEAGNTGDWALWLGMLDTMGRRIATARDAQESVEATQLMAGVNIELDALRLRQALAEKAGASDAETAKKIEQLNEAMRVMAAYEDEREREIETSRAAVKRPFVMVLGAVLSFSAAFALVWAFGMATRAEPRTVALAHSRAGVAVLAGGLGALGLLLLLLTLGGRAWVPAELAENTWFVLVYALILFGALYPSLALPSLRTVRVRMGDAGPEALRAARRARRSAGVALARRYFGVLNGGVFMILAVWLLIFRAAHGVYPHQFALLVSGAEALTVQAVSRALALLP